MNPALPDAFVHTVRTTFDDGAGWLERLPALLDDLAETWELTLLSPRWPLSYNYVCPATRADGSPAVLKVGVPSAELRSERRALTLWNGHGSVRTLASDLARGALLLERLTPGTMLSTLPDDDAATRIAARSMADLWISIGDEPDLPTLAEWHTDAFETVRAHRAFFGPLGERAAQLQDTLLSSAPEPVLLHGDVHHFNILQDERQGWIVIDPKGLRGEPAYEVGAFLRNPGPEQACDPDVLHRRLTILRESLPVPYERMVAWAFVSAVVSAAWGYDDRESPWVSDTLAHAALLASLL